MPFQFHTLGITTASAALPTFFNANTLEPYKPPPPGRRYYTVRRPIPKRWGLGIFCGLAGICGIVSCLPFLEKWARPRVREFSRSSNSIVRYCAHKYITLYRQERDPVIQQRGIFYRYFTYSRDEWLTSKLNLVNMVTHLFAHGSIAHYAINMTALYTGIMFLSPMMSRAKFLTTLLASGVLAANIESAIGDSNRPFTNLSLSELKRRLDLLGQSNESKSSHFNLPRKSSIQEPTSRGIGLSGALCGVFTIAAFMNPYVGVSVMFLPAIPLWIAITGQFSLDLAGWWLRWQDGIGHGAHMGGNAAGVLLWLLWLRRPGGISLHRGSW
ncbi:MAG: hypothetical protein M1834_002279 [Cirrosporium novae-zelandiae]|nr:MAG: hypothetical protein M1834_002279 [Cirrosporium novae-zelandiae]